MPQIILMENKMSMAKSLKGTKPEPEKTEIERFGKGVYLDPHSHVYFFYDGASDNLSTGGKLELSVKSPLTKQLFHIPKKEMPPFPASYKKNYQGMKGSRISKTIFQGRSNS
jgi:hypothetical protein